MSGALYRLGRFAARRSLWVIGAWALFAIAIVLVASATGRPTSDDDTIPGSDSTRATNFLERELPVQANGSVPIVLEARTGTLTQGSNETAVQATVQSLKQNRYVRRAISPLSQKGASALSDDGTIGSISLFLTVGSADLEDDAAESVFAAADPARQAGLRVAAGGYLGQQLSQPSTRLSEIVGIAAAMLVLILALGGATAMVMPITTAIVGVIAGLSLVGALGAVIDVPSLAPTLGIMLGLAVGVDYSLFIVTRHLRLLEEGRDVDEAVGGALATSGGAVVFAGGTVILSLLALYFGGIPLVRALGYSTAIAIAVVIVAALTLLPAGLGLLGHRIHALAIVDRLRRRRAQRRANGGGEETGDSGAGARWAAAVGRRPLIAAAAGIVALAVLALPVLDISLGAQDTGQQSKSTTARHAYDMTTAGFGVGANGPLLVAVDIHPPAEPNTAKLNQVEEQQAEQQQAVELGEAPPPTEAQQQQAQQQEEFLSSPASDPRLVKLTNQISSTADVDQVSPATLNDAGTAAAITVVPDSAPSAERTRRLVHQLRDTVIPRALQGTQMRADVGGTTAANIDLADKIADTLPIVIAVIVGISFVLLTLAFRSLVIPAIASVLNLIAVAAAYGVLTAVFQDGWGVELIGLDHALPVVSFVPLMMFAVLFGLSTDYTVFLLSRVSEEYELHGDHRRATVEGLARASRVIVAAATIMALVFASFILSGDPTVKQFGVGLAVAVVVDAIVVCLVLPALILLIGRASWWMPEPIERRLPRLGIEGDASLAGERSAAG